MTTVDVAQIGREYSAASGTAIAESCRSSCIQLLSLLLLPVLLLRLFPLQLVQPSPSLLQNLIAVIILVIVSIKLLMLDTHASQAQTADLHNGGTVYDVIKCTFFNNGGCD